MPRPRARSTGPARCATAQRRDHRSSWSPRRRAAPPWRSYWRCSPVAPRGPRARWALRASAAPPTKMICWRSVSIRPGSVALPRVRMLRCGSCEQQPRATADSVATTSANAGIHHITGDAAIVCSCCGQTGHAAHACTAFMSDEGVTRVCSSLDWEVSAEPAARVQDHPLLPLPICAPA